MLHGRKFQSDSSLNFLLFLFPGGKEGLDQLIHLYFDPTPDVRWMQEEVCATPIMIAHAILSFCHALMPWVFSLWEPKLIIMSSISFTAMSMIFLCT